MRRRLTRLRLRLPWWALRLTRPGPGLVLDHRYFHGWGRRPVAAREPRTEPMPPVPTAMLFFPLRCQGADDCQSCAAYVDGAVVPLVEV